MKRSQTLFLAAILSAGFAAPALADYVRLGSVDVGFRTDRDSAWTRFGGHMEGLRIEADRSDVFCRSIVAHFDNGGSQNVFSGRLLDNRPIYVDLRGGTRLVRNITFTCRSDERSGAKIYISAEVGRFQNEWRNSPGWATMWSQLFHWGNAGMNSGYDPNYWVSLGRERFQGRGDRESTFTGWSGRSVERIGLRAINADARCSRVQVNFANGASKVYQVGYLTQGRLQSFDLPGGNRNVRSLDLKCRAVNGYAVSIEVLVRK